MPSTITPQATRPDLADGVPFSARVDSSHPTPTARVVSNPEVCLRDRQAFCRSLDRSLGRWYLTFVLNTTKQPVGPDPLSTTLAALADPTRRAILSRLSSGEATVTQLAEPFAMSLPAVSRHLKVLQRAGLITRGQTAQWRPCRLEAEPLLGVQLWVEQYRRHWEQRLDRLDRYLQEVASSAKPGSKRSRSRRRGRDDDRRR